MLFTCKLAIFSVLSDELSMFIEWVDSDVGMAGLPVRVEEDKEFESSMGLVAGLFTMLMLLERGLVR